MNSPCTAKPKSRRRSAATAESTPPDMPTMTVPAVLGSGKPLRMRPLYGRHPRSRRLHEHLPHLRFLHARLPHFVEEVQIAAHYGRIVHIRNAVPSVRLQSIHQRLIVGDDEGAGAGRIIGTHG